jgi:hypothetical protein
MGAEGPVIQGISPAATYLSPSILSVDAIRAGKRSVPVRPSFSLYLFKHVMGVPSRSGEEQVPISKLRVLDNLIDRLVKLRGETGEMIRVDGENVGALTQRFQGELHAALRAATPLFSGLFPETGLIVNLLA